ncbi:hypothetical protein L7F22_011171 [Adiantum nelumboides]|nr:hypothetical protein [Adiantum nelumboides]
MHCHLLEYDIGLLLFDNILPTPKGKVISKQISQAEKDQEVKEVEVEFQEEQEKLQIKGMLDIAKFKAGNITKVKDLDIEEGDLDPLPARQNGDHVQRSVIPNGEQVQPQQGGGGGGCGDASNDEPVNPRRSTCIYKPPDQYVPTMDFVMLTDCDEPCSYTEAMKRDDHVKWKKFMKSEMDPLHKNGTWDLVPLPKGTKALPYHHGSSSNKATKVPRDGVIGSYRKLHFERRVSTRLHKGSKAEANQEGKFIFVLRRCPLPKRKRSNLQEIPVNGNKRFLHGPRQLIYENGPFEKWGIHAMGPLPRTKNGKLYILVAIDYMTRWVEAQSVTRVNEKTVSRFVYTHIWCRFGTPLEIVFDNGPGFRKGLLTEVCEELHILHRHSTPYYPQSNGLVEKANGIIAGIIRKMVKNKTKLWDDFLDGALWAYWTTYKEATEFTPFHLVYGQEALQPIKLNIPSMRLHWGKQHKEKKKHGQILFLP